MSLRSPVLGRPRFEHVCTHPSLGPESGQRNGSPLLGREPRLNWVEGVLSVLHRVPLTVGAHLLDRGANLAPQASLAVAPLLLLQPIILPHWGAFALEALTLAATTLEATFLGVGGVRVRGHLALALASHPVVVSPRALVALLLLMARAHAAIRIFNRPRWHLCDREGKCQDSAAAPERDI